MKMQRKGDKLLGIDGCADPAADLCVGLTCISWKTKRELDSNSHLQ
jgi:hypothetical protein